MAKTVVDKHNKFVMEYGALIFYEKQGSKVSFESLPEAEKEQWYGLAVSSRIALDKMNKVVIDRSEHRSRAEEELDRNKFVSRLTLIIHEFVKGLKMLKCPKCGSNAEVRGALFPCEELACRIWAGGKQDG